MATASTGHIEGIPPSDARQGNSRWRVVLIGIGLLTSLVCGVCAVIDFWNGEYGRGYINANWAFVLSFGLRADNRIWNWLDRHPRLGSFIYFEMCLGLIALAFVTAIKR